MHAVSPSYYKGERKSCENIGQIWEEERKGHGVLKAATQSGSQSSSKLVVNVLHHSEEYFLLPQKNDVKNNNGGCKLKLLVVWKWEH